MVSCIFINIITTLLILYIRRRIRNSKRLKQGKILFLSYIGD